MQALGSSAILFTLMACATLRVESRRGSDTATRAVAFSVE